MLKHIDALLDRITMYRVVLYELLGLLGFAVVYAFFHLVPSSPLAIVFSTLFITTVCVAANYTCARVFKAPANAESVYITALVLALIIAPPSSPFDASYFSFAVWASIWAMASKYLFAIRNKHVFNPAAFGVALIAMTLNHSANWWIGTPALFPVVLVGGWLVTRKIRRMDLVVSFLTVALATIAGSALLRGTPLVPFLAKTLTQTPLVFFATVMLTEPLTTPPTRQLRVAYGALVGLLYAPWMHFGPLYSTPELALLLGNVFSYAVSPKEKLILTLKKKVAEANQTADFVFTPDQSMKFTPGQYLEWTLAHPDPDMRGNRRYFTIASAPTEKEIHLGVKFYENGSTFKKALDAMKPGDTLVASQLTGDFVLPKRVDEKLAFIAGGIGVTPFRSMIQSAVDLNERRPIVMLYANKTPGDIAYADVFERAWQKIGVHTVYVLTDAKSAPKGWNGRVGSIDAKMIEEEIPDFLERRFYLSGPHGMVVAYDAVLRQMGVPASKIKKDFFPGFA